MLRPRPRQAWCPRCDEVRHARAGAPCPRCSARLVGLPRGSGPAHWLASWEALLQRVRSLLPALRAVAVGVVVLMLVAGAFVAGRSSSPASAASAAPATTVPPTLTLPGGRVLVGPQRYFGWQETRGETTLTLRAMFTAAESTSATFEVTGLDGGWTVEGMEDLRVLDGQGRRLALTRFAQDMRGFRSRGDGDSVITVSLQSRVDPNAVASVSIGRLILGQQLEESLAGTLVDADLKRRVDQSEPGRASAAGPASCPSCRLQVRCGVCQTVRVAGTAYRHDHVTMLLASTSRVPGESLANADIIVSGASGQIGSLDTTLEGGDTVITFDGRDLAGITERGQPRMPFSVTATFNRVRFLPGPWQLDQRSGSR